MPTTVHDDAASTLDNVVGIQGVQTGGSGANMSATGGTGHVVKQPSVGAAFTTGTVTSTDIADNALTLAKLAQGAGMSVIGVAGSSTANHADIAASANDRFLYRTGNVLGFVRYPYILLTPSGVAATDTANLQAAVDSADNVHVQLTSGIFEFNDTIRINRVGVKISGVGPRSTQCYFVPPSSGAVLFHFQFATATAISECALRDMTILSNDSTTRKVAIKLVDVSQFILERVFIGVGVPWVGDSSIGIQTQGREYLKARDVKIYANRCLLFEKNPNIAGGYDLDHFTFERVQAVSQSTTRPCVEAATGVFFTNTVFRDLSMALGNQGFYYLDTTSAGYSNTLTFDNIRWEQQDIGGSGYAIYLSSNHGMRNVAIRSLLVGAHTPDMNGIYARNVEQLTIQDMTYADTTGVALNCDGTDHEVLLLNCWFQAGSTISMTDMRRVSAMGRHKETTSPAHSLELWCSVTENTNIVDGVTLNDASFNIVDDGDATKKIAFQASGITAGQRRVLTAPDYDGTIATLAGSEALTNKSYQGSTVQTTGNVGVGMAPSGTIGRLLEAQLDGNQTTRFNVANKDASGVSAIAAVRAEGSTAVARIAGFGSGVPTLFLGVTAGGYSVFDNGGAGNGLLIGTSNAMPVRIGASDKTGVMLDGTNPHPSFPASHKRVTTQYDNATTTLGAVTGLTVNVTAAKSYAFRAILHTTSDVGGGVKCAIAGTCTATSIIYDAAVYYGGQTVGTTNQRGTALGTTVGQVTAVTTAKIIVDGIITVANAGTLLPQLAANVAVGTTSALVGSEWFVWEIQ